MNPSRAQYRMLHVLSQAKLEFQTSPTRKVEILQSNGLIHPDSWRFHEVTARIVVESGWAELTKFNARRGEYGITIDGLALAHEFCECPGRRGEREPRRSGRMIDWHLKESTEVLVGKLLCIYCGRWVRCVSRKSEPHGAMRWHVRYGPVCARHPVSGKQ